MLYAQCIKSFKLREQVIPFGLTFIGQTLNTYNTTLHIYDIATFNRTYSKFTFVIIDIIVIKISGKRKAKTNNGIQTTRYTMNEERIIIKEIF